MPRRKTRKVTRNKNSDLDASIVADGSDELQLKKETFLRDFDIQVQRRLAAMESEMKSMCKEIERMLTTQKLKIKKDIRTMKLKDFIACGGDIKILDFSEVSEALSGDVSFQEAPADVDTTFKAPVSTAQKTLRKRAAAVAPSPLVQDAPLTRTRTRAGQRKVTQTPMVSNKNQRLMETPLITPKFDPRLPLTTAREPKKGETLWSLAGSPVLHNTQNNPSNDTVLSLCLSKQQTFMSGSLFDMTMSPNTLMSNKERLQEAMGAINSRLEDLDTQLTMQSKLNET